MTTSITDPSVFSAIGVRTSADPVQQESKSQQADFLLLMTEQIKHQNPLNPMEGADFLAQLAQFSTVEQLAQLNDKFEQLAGSLVSDQSLQAASLIGKRAVVAANQGWLGADSPLEGNVNLPLPAGELRVNFYDQVGQLVRQLDLGARPAGDVRFAWDGTTDTGDWAGQGNYRMEVLADMGGGTEALNPSISAPVDSVSLGDGGNLILNLAGAGSVPYSAVQAIR
jgi:flagellar basal-body rod modification protein FlgD